MRVHDFYVAIDAGWPGCMSQYMRGQKGHGIKPQCIRYLLVTHFHPDHAGLVEHIKQLGARFVVFEHQLPHIAAMEKMLGRERSYQPLDVDTSSVLEIDQADSFFEANGIPARAIRTTGHSDDSVSIVFHDGCAFVGDLYSPDLVMEDDAQSQQSWHALRVAGAKEIFPAHGDAYLVD